MAARRCTIASPTDFERQHSLSLAPLWQLVDMIRRANLATPIIALGLVERDDGSITINLQVGDERIETDEARRLFTTVRLMVTVLFQAPVTWVALIAWLCPGQVEEVFECADPDSLTPTLTQVNHAMVIPLEQGGHLVVTMVNNPPSYPFRVVMIRH